MELNKEEHIFYKHLTESAHSAYYKEIRIYTDFLSLNEISIFKYAVNGAFDDLPVIKDIAYSMWGGIKDAERVRICFHGDIQMNKNEIHDIDMINPSLYPIACIHVKPADYKFSEASSHRDYLGAVLNLGLTRGKIGDILVDEKDGYIFCDEMMTGFITENLVKVRNTNVRASICDISSIELKKKYEVITGSVSSIRLDSIIKTAFNASRSSILPYISGRKVLINGREAVSNSCPLKEGDIISVRGLGKFKFDGQGGVTKKGRINIKISKYI